MAAPPPSPLLLLLGALLVPSAARAPAAKAETVQVTVGVLLPERNLRFPWAWPRVAPALSLALEALQPQLSLDGLAVRTAFAFASNENEEGRCIDHLAVLKALDLEGSHDPDVLLGLSCFAHSYLLVSFAYHWWLPVLRAGAYVRSDRLPDEVYAGPLGLNLATFQAQLFRHFNWTGHFLMLIGSDLDTSHYCDFSDSPGISVRSYYYDGPDDAVRYIQAQSRVAFFCGPLEDLHQIMCLAHAQNMTNGDYVFFYLDPFGESLRAAGHREARKPWQSKKTQDTRGLREAFQAVLAITPHEPQTPEYRHFENELVLRAQRDFGVAINDSLGHLVAGCYHDGLLLYLRALNETLHEGGTKRDTSRILEKMRSLKIQGVTGMLSINNNNDREMDFDVWAMRDVETGEYQVVLHYIASEKMMNRTGDILWKKGAPPLVVKKKKKKD